MEYKDNVGNAAVGFAALLFAVAVLALTPRPLGYLAVFAFALAFRRRVVWARLAPSYLALSAAAYFVAFLLDYVFVGVPQYLAHWWEAAVLAPLAEELVFRALAFALLPPPLAWLFAVVLFGLLHPANPFIASLYGVSLAFIYRGGGYVAAVALHAVNNAVWLALAAGLL